MMDFLKGAISVMLLIGLLCLGVWFAAVDNTNKKWELRLARANHKVDSLLEIERIPVPPETVKTKQASKPLTPASRAAVDSAFNAGMRKGIDSARAYAHYLAEREDTTLTFTSGTDTLGVLRHRYDPPTHVGIYEFAASPVKRERLVIMDSVFVPMPAPEPFWEKPAIFGAGVLVGAVLILLR